MVAKCNGACGAPTPAVATIDGRFSGGFQSNGNWRLSKKMSGPGRTGPLAAEGVVFELTWSWGLWAFVQKSTSQQLCAILLNTHVMNMTHVSFPVITAFTAIPEAFRRQSHRTRTHVV